MKNKYVHLLFNNELFFPKNSIPIKVSFGDYIGFIIVNGMKVFAGALLLAFFVLSVDIFINVITNNNGTMPIFHFEEGSFNYYVVVFLGLICFFYFLIAFGYNLNLSFRYFGAIFSSSRFKFLKKTYDNQIKNLKIEFKNKLVQDTMNNKSSNLQQEFSIRKQKMKSDLKAKFVEFELNKMKNLNSKNISNEKLKIEKLFEEIIK